MTPGPAEAARTAVRWPGWGRGWPKPGPAVVAMRNVTMVIAGAFMGRFFAELRREGRRIAMAVALRQVPARLVDAGFTLPGPLASGSRLVPANRHALC
jgi:hypothetical protein